MTKTFDRSVYIIEDTYSEFNSLSTSFYGHGWNVFPKNRDEIEYYQKLYGKDTDIENPTIVNIQQTIEKELILNNLIEKVDLIVLDLYLIDKEEVPKSNTSGVSILNQIRHYRTGKEIPIIVLTRQEENMDTINLLLKPIERADAYFEKGKLEEETTNVKFFVTCNVAADLYRRKHRSIKNAPVVPDVLSDIFTNFHKCAKQLENRYDGRKTLEINDEYDVQDLLHSILKIRFNDIRKEESVPSYIGANSRIDFVLKKENILIEVKYVKENHKDAKIGGEIKADILNYQSYSESFMLIFFLYNPHSSLQNSGGLIDDIRKISNEKHQYEVYICP